MIKLTEEMEDAAYQAWGPEQITGNLYSALEAVLKIVNREHEKQVKAAYTEGYAAGWAEGAND